MDVYLSPHFDDALISCGGAVAAAVDHGRPVLVATVFGGAMPDGFVPGSLVRWLHRACGSGADLVARRRREDAAALAHLGVPGIALDHPEAAYRLRPDGTPNRSGDLWLDPLPGESALLDALADDLERALPGRMSSVHVPLGLGGHRDHRLTRLAGEAVAARRGADVVWYEDLPYAARGGSGFLRAATADLVPWLHELSGPDLRRKFDALGEYATQVRMIWGSRGAMERELTWYGRAISDGATGDERAEAAANPGGRHRFGPVAAEREWVRR